MELSTEEKEQLKTASKPELIRVSDVMWDIPPGTKHGMRVPARIIATKKLIDAMDLQVYDQITNVATLPGIQKYAFCMPDGHMGYGFPIGGVAAFDANEGGVISPGGIGFDINCGMRLVLTNLSYGEVMPHIHTLVDMLFRRVPAGVGSRGFVKLSREVFRDEVAVEGSQWAVRNGYGWKEDLERTELYGRADWADSSAISRKSVERGFTQIGTLGSGNHYLEIQWVKPENIFNEQLAKKWGLFPNQIVIMFHCGSRGFGHQVATDYLLLFLSVMEHKYGIKILDRELACAPFFSPEGQAYYKGMGCAVNMSFANRQVILHRIREVFSEFFRKGPEELGLHMVFDVSHNRGTLEKHEVDGKVKELIVHRKGATGSYYPGRIEIPAFYREDGSPVIIGGSMETGSYLLVGGPSAKETFCSTAHGSGRTMSRTKAKKLVRGQELLRELKEKGIYIKSVSYAGVAEEAGFAYKNIDDVVEAASLAGISLPVAKLVPLGNVKG
jgi:tRNA-splicing ligase RtcB